MTIQEIVDLYREMETYTINNMIKTMKKHIKDQEIEGFEWESWRTLQLKSLQEFRKKNEKLLGSFDERTITNIETLLKGYYTEGALSQEREILQGIVDGARVKPNKTLKKQLNNIKGENTKEKVQNVLSLDGTFFNINNTQMKNLINESINPIKEANKSYLRYSNKMYNDILTKTEIFAKGTGLTTHKAIDKASQEFIKNGICCVKYRMKDGSTRNVNICSYVEMCIRTNATRMKEEAAAEQRNKFGINTVVVSSYSSCSKLCYEYQGKVYYDDYFQSLEVPDDKYPRLSSAVGPTKLFHCNCKHHLRSYFSEVNSKPTQYTKKETEENSKLVSKQRELERKVRSWENLKNNTSDKTTKLGYEKKWIESKNELNKFIKDNSDVLRRDEWRESNVLNRYKRIEEIEGLRKGDPTPIEKIIKEMELKKPLTEKLKDKGVIIEGRFSFDDEEVRNHLLNQMNDLTNRYNVLENKITIKSKKESNNNAAAYYTHTKKMSENSITFNKKFFESIEDIKRLEKSNMEKGWTVKAYPEKMLDVTLAHEFGHLVERNIVNKEFNDYITYSSDFSSVYNRLCNELKNEILAMYKKKYGRALDIRNELSLYAMSNSKEFFAEAFCKLEVMDDSEVSEVMKEFLRKYNILKE